MKKGLSKPKRREMIWVMCLTVILILVGIVPSLAEDGETGLEVSGLQVIHELEFGGVYITLTIEEFNDLGFAFGDSVNVVFSNGYTLEDIPYYNGFYCHNGETLLIGYPKYDYIKACINYGDDLWDVAGLDENDTARIALNERGNMRTSRKQEIFAMETTEACTKAMRFLPISETYAWEICGKGCSTGRLPPATISITGRPMRMHSLRTPGSVSF